MCDPVAGAAAHAHPDVTETVESTAQTNFVAKEATGHAHSEKTETAPRKAGAVSAQNNNWLEEAEKIKAPPLAASQNDWSAYAEKLGKVAGISEGLLTDMIRTKNVPSANGAHDAGDGSGEQVHGLLSVHGGLLEGGIYGETTHALKDSSGNALTSADMQDPGKATLAGVQHLKQLIDHYDGNQTAALNHYQTGDKTNSAHPLKDWCDGSTCPDGTETHAATHGAEASKPVLKLRIDEADTIASALGSNAAAATSAAHGGHGGTATESATATAGHGAHGGGHGATATATESATATAGHGAHGGGHGATATATESAAATAGHGAHGGGHGATATATESAAAPAGHGAHGGGHGGVASSGASGNHRITGLGFDGSLGEYITPSSSTASEHLGESHGLGFLMHRGTHDAAMETVFGKPAADVLKSVQSGLEDSGTYLYNKSDTEKTKGAYLAANMLMKQEMLPAALFGSETEAGTAYANAKLKAIDGDVAGLKSVIESNGGDTLGLTDEQLLNIWATNEHNNLHAILDAGKPVGQSIHMTSLNDNAKDGTAKATLGGYNDKGAYPQWGWFEDIKSISNLFPDLQVGARQAA